MKFGRIVGGVVLGVSLCSPVYAWYESEDSHDQSNDQSQTQDQKQYQAQAAVGVGVGVGGEASQSSEQANQQDVSVSQNTSRERTVAKAAPALAVPSDSEGVTGYAPWFGGGIVKPSEQKAVATYLNAQAEFGASTDSRVQKAVEQLRRASIPCRLVGVGPQRFGVLGNVLCWPSWRKSDYRRD